MCKPRPTGISLALFLLLLGASPAFPQDPGPEELIDRLAREEAFKVREKTVSAREERLMRIEHALADLQRQLRELREEVKTLGASAQESRQR